MTLKNIGGFLKIGRLIGCHQSLRGHHLVDLTVEIAFKTEVAVGHDTQKTAIVVDNRNSTDMILFHDCKGIGHGRSALDGHGIIDHAVFSTLHGMHLTRLLFNAHILVDHTDTAFTGNGNSHRCLSHGVHSGRNKRHIEGDSTRKLGG